MRNLTSFSQIDDAHINAKIIHSIMIYLPPPQSAAKLHGWNEKKENKFYVMVIDTKIQEELSKIPGVTLLSLGTIIVD